MLACCVPCYLAIALVPPYRLLSVLVKEFRKKVNLHVFIKLQSYDKLG